MKQRVDRLAENNTATVTLIKAYSPHVRTEAFTTGGGQIPQLCLCLARPLEHVMELFMAGGNYAVSGMPFPSNFAAAVDAGIAAAN